ncbi:MAG: type VII secretion protein EssC [Bacilli bacterium]|nr:type VII secretion protein EssC [Bacilli bacterium]
MRIYMFLDDMKSYQIYRLPNIIDGNYWVTYQKDEMTLNFLNVYSNEGNWVFHDRGQIIPLKEYTTYEIKGIKIYTAPLYDTSIEIYALKDLNKITIGGAASDILYSSLSDNQITLTRKDEQWLIQNNKLEIPLYVNRVITSGKLLSSKDHIFLNGLELIMLGKYFIINNPLDKTKILNPAIVKMGLPKIQESIDGDLDEISIFEKKDYFYRSPRFRNLIEEVTIKIDPPPNSGQKEELPWLLQMGSMLTMGVSSLMTLFIALTNLFSGQSLLRTLPSLVMAIVMLIGMLLIPNLTRKYQKEQSIQKEKVRQEKYLKYLAQKKEMIYQVMKDQQRALQENSVSLKQCEDIIMHHRRNLWERKIEHDDFLMAHIGIGEVPAKININFPEDHFSLDNDNLKEELSNMGKEPRNLKEVPINVSFVEKNICAILGNNELIPAFLNTILLQFITFHSYEDVKFVILTNSEDKKRWQDLKETPYLWNKERSLRYYAETKEEKFIICNELNTILQSRIESDEKDYRYFLPYYIIITDDFQSIRDFEFIKNALRNPINVGFSFIIMNQRLMGLPNECNSFINIDTMKSGMIENELATDRQLIFEAEFLNQSLEKIYQTVSNIPIAFQEEQGIIPKSLSFLEMYNVGRVEQLNALNRWKSNNSTDTLAAPVGFDQNGSEFQLDLHEKAHGPHGLVAGMTGSGKSEFIITYILSMAVNYHPDDVSFVLIDYKGGGLAGAFENKELQVKLPHLAGTITNLDTVEIKRSLASIESELKRRQRLFNEAREKTNESTINIYKYQKLYHQGIVTEAIPHLFIISDEFAELKSQQPEFMAQLISTARIGRSLGVHLILATQKPSGVVDAQIWSNSKFRVCLKVQDRSDSMDMIKVPDAAALSIVGRFYLQVGYNELFALGQSAWCGAPYYEMDERKKKIDSSLDYINNIGRIIKTVEQGNENKKSAYKGEELPAILKYLSDLAKKEKVQAQNLWLPSIAAEITVADLEQKYHYQRQSFWINEIIGEYDDPSNQSQNMLTLPLSSEGNALVYGTSGSGKENFLTTFIYSTITHHTPEEVNLYLLDFGAETLRTFRFAPHIGDVILSSDHDKIINLFKMLDGMIEKRKKLFLEYGGNYYDFIMKSETKLPNVIVIINNYDNFKELYGDFEDTITSLTRECTKFGIYFILSAVSSNAIRLRLSQNFKTTYCLQMNNNDDYSAVLGNIYRTYPSKIYGRGLVKINGKPLEFQTAFAYPKEENLEKIQNVCQYYQQEYSMKAPSVPVLPAHVYLSHFEKKSTLEDWIVGMTKETLEVATYNLTSKLIHLVTGQELERLSPFTYALIESLQSIPNNLLFVIDPEKNLKKSNRLSKYFYQENWHDNFSVCYEYMTKLMNDLETNHDENRKEKYTHLTLVIYGVEEFVSTIKSEQEKLMDMLQKGKKLEKLTIILIDAIDRLKKCEYESWYSENVNNNQGIWVGNGIAEQYSLKLSKIPKYCHQEIPDTFGYLVKSGRPIPIKLLEREEKNE